MGLVTPTFIFVPGTTADATQVNADLAAIIFELNGNINADNALTDDGPVSVGRRLLTGSSLSLALADHEHTVNGNEPLPADPSTANFVGREYFNTISLEKRLCIDATGSGTWVTSGNPTATELAVHAAQHKDGGHDPLADNTITDHMKAAGTVVTASIAADITIPSTTWTTIVSADVTTKNSQLVLVFCRAYCVNGSGSNQPIIRLRVLDHTASDATVFRSEGTRLGISTGVNQRDIFYAFPYTSPGDGVHTLQFQVDASGSGITVTRPTAQDGDSTRDPELKALVV